MKNIYLGIEKYFEKFSLLFTKILGSSITFFLALIAIVIWCCQKEFLDSSLYKKIYNVIIGISFLTLFVIQKEFSKFSALMHLKINELVTSNKSASNEVVHAENKTENEINILAKENIEKAEEKEKDT
jgi:low affinity Fe/Cu permease